MIYRIIGLKQPTLQDNWSCFISVRALPSCVEGNETKTLKRKCMAHSGIEPAESSLCVHNENICLHWELNQRPLAFQAGALDHWTTLMRCSLNSYTILAFD